jgi:site-specific DNA recombinase
MTKRAANRKESKERNGDRAHAIMYLRVSTREQAEMGGEAEGYSIPAQRDACLRKAESLGAVVDEEFVDRGESAKTANRPELIRMLRHVREHPIQYVIVHKVDRLARSRADDVAITMAIRKSGAMLVSCSENIDETPSGLLVHGIMSDIAEFYSRNLALEVTKGMGQKVKAGGTVGKAPIGYVHLRQVENGREMRTVGVDPERATLIRWAFEAYATGEWTLRQLLEEMTERGLTTRPGPHTPSKKPSLNGLAKLLANRYYIGEVVYCGVHYPGKHTPLIDGDLFDQVQSVLSAHNYAGEKQQVHNHYLKGSIYCGKCGRRLGVSNSRSHTGVVYDYFYCVGRQRDPRSCSQRFIRMPIVERRVEDHYRSIQLTPARVASVSEDLKNALSARQTAAVEAKHTLTLRIQRLTSERRKLLELHYAEAMPIDLFREEQERITREREQAETQLAGVSMTFEVIAENMARALELARDCHAAYVAADSNVRRLFNQAFFHRLYVHDDGEITHELAEPFKLLLDPELPDRLIAAAREEGPARPNQPTSSSLGIDNKDDLAESEAVGSNMMVLVDLSGLEPQAVAGPADHRPGPSDRHAFCCSCDPCLCEGARHARG